MQSLSSLNPELMDAIRQDPELMEEVAHSRTRAIELLDAEGLSMDVDAFSEAVAEFANSGTISSRSDAVAFMEAIILRMGRPSFLIRNGTYEIPSGQRIWKDRLQPRRLDIENAIKAVGRVELQGHESFAWVGTAWLVERDLIVTNRHVASIFAQGGNGNFTFRPGRGGVGIRASVDFKEEFNITAEDSVAIDRILFIAPDRTGQPDMAVLKLGRTASGPPIPLADTSQPEGEYVAAIGYPARDDLRNDPGAALSIFNDIYQKKRIAPGQIMLSGVSDPGVFRHDCSTLGGNSGSVILDVNTGKALGLHFAGRFEDANLAVRIEAVKQVLANVSRTSRTRRSVTEAPASADSYADRPGYQPDFLGGDESYVALPVVRKSPADQLRQTAGPHKGSSELKYMHFSIVMSRSRKMPYFTAVNIDGESLRRPPRDADVWRFDPRIPESAQLGNSLYQGNNLDRGHQVRRLDPVWGETAEALLAQEDTFHYTNSCPQHARLNQGRTFWAGLEDYILDNTDRRNLKISVFTGPVLNAQGVSYRGSLIPDECWKVAVNVRDDGRLSATGYLLSQGQFLGDIEFAFGAFRTFQVPVHQLELLTGLSFGALAEFDPLGRSEGIAGAIEIDSLDRIVL